MRQNVEKLAGFIDAVRYAPAEPKRRGRPRKGSEWVRASGKHTSDQLSLITLDWTAQAAMRKKPLKRYAAWLSLGNAVLGVDPRKGTRDTVDDALAVTVGMQIADLVTEAGIIEDLRPPRGKHRDKTPVTLTPATLAGVEYLLDQAPAPVLTEQPTNAPYVKQSPRSRTPVVPPGAAVSKALHALTGTEWSINQEVLKRARAFYRGKRETLKPAVRAAMHTAEKIKKSFFLDGHFDWRGRFYQDGVRGLQWTSAEDLPRAFMQFHDGYPLDEYTLPFLELHITSMWGAGVDKRTDAARVQWVRDNRADILACAAAGKLWLKASKKWRFLAAAYAYRDALDGKPVHLPCSFDVTCSGVGIYAMLVRDIELARLVGITRSAFDGAPDFYQHVADRCPPRVIRRKGRPEVAAPWTRSQAKAVIKKAMYGAGEVPGKEPRPHPVRAAMWQAMGTDARALFDWLRTAAAARDVLTWTLPDGFTVSQDYRVVNAETLEAYSGTRRIQLQRNTVSHEPDRLKSEMGIAANFIQSYDGAYLREVVRIGSTLGIPAWGVAHDCFSVHPAFGAQLIAPMGAIQQAVLAVFGPDRLSELNWGGLVPGKRGKLSTRDGWDLGPIVG